MPMIGQPVGFGELILKRLRLVDRRMLQVAERFGIGVIEDTADSAQGDRKNFRRRDESENYLCGTTGLFFQEKIGEIQSQLGEIQGRIGEHQGEIGEKQGAIGEKMGELGEQMGQIGEKQGQMAEEAARKLKSILNQAVKDGKAKPVE